MKIKYVITNIVQTCGACPTQWEATLDSGHMLYIRYRWGYLSIRISPKKTKDIYKAVGGEEIYGEQLGDGYDGCLSDAELHKIFIKEGIMFNKKL